MKPEGRDRRSEVRGQIIFLISILCSLISAFGQTSKTPIYNGILQSNLDAAGYKILSSNMVDYAGTGMTWNAVTGKFDVTGGGGSGTVTTTGSPTSGQMTKFSGATSITNAVAGTDYLTGNQNISLTGDVTGGPAATSIATTIGANKVTLGMMATMATDSILGRATALTGNVEVLTALPFAFTGDVTRPIDSNVTTLAAGNAGNLNSGTLLAARMPALTGDVTTSVGAVATTIANSAVTYAKMQNVSANSKLLGSSATGSGAPPSELTLGTNLSMSGSTLNATAGGSGTVTSITATSPIVVTPTPLTATGVISLNAAVDLNMTVAQTTTLTDAATNTISPVLTLTHNSSGAPSTSYGTGILFNGKSDTTVGRTMGQISAVWVTATDASRNAAIRFQAADSTALGASGVYVFKSGSISNSDLVDHGAGTINAGSGFTSQNVAAINGNFLQGNGTAYRNSSYTFPTTVSATGTMLQSNGTNYAGSTPTWPTSAGTKGSDTRSDGTNFVLNSVPYGVVTATVDQTAIAEQAHVVYTVPANSAAVGTTYRIAAWGDMDNGTTAITFTPRVRWGGTGGVQLIAAPTVVSSTTALTNKTWRMVANVTIRTIGASGTAFAEVQLSNHTVSSAGAYGGDEASSGGTGVTINTTTSNDLDFTWTLSATTGTPHVRTYGGYVEIIN